MNFIEIFSHFVFVTELYKMNISQSQPFLSERPPFNPSYFNFIAIELWGLYLSLTSRLLLLSMRYFLTFCFLPLLLPSYVCASVMRAVVICASYTYNFVIGLCAYKENVTGPLYIIKRNRITLLFFLYNLFYSCGSKSSNCFIFRVITRIQTLTQYKSMHI